jgi:hypothetical protein
LAIWVSILTSYNYKKLNIGLKKQKYLALLFKGKKAVRLKREILLSYGSRVSSPFNQKYSKIKIILNIYIKKDN